MLLFDWLVHFWRENYVSCLRVANGELVSVSVDVDLLRSPMALASSGRPSANGVPSSLLLWLSLRLCRQVGSHAAWEQV